MDRPGIALEDQVVEGPVVEDLVVTEAIGIASDDLVLKDPGTSFEDLALEVPGIVSKD